MEAEVDQVLPRHLAADQAALLRAGRARHEVELHARQALLEIEEVDRFHAPDDALALRVDRLVGVQRHGA
jgi:hypothetical protein